MAAQSALVSRRRLLALAGLGAAAVASPVGLSACSTAAEKRVSFLNWQDYVDPALLKQFSEKTGLAVGYETYESNDELERRLSAAAVTRKGGRKTTSFDLVVPSTNLFSRLRAGNALQPLDRDIVTAELLDNLEPTQSDLAADRGNVFSVPWATGTTGIGYDSTVFDQPPSWDVFLDEQYAGKMSLLNETREAFAAAAFSLGLDPNSTAAADVTAAGARLGEFLKSADLNSATYLDDLADGTLVVAQGFSTDVLQAAKRNPNLRYSVPSAGGTVWTDHLCIPVDAPNPQGANELVAFYLDPEVSAANAEFNLVSTGNRAARALLGPELLANPAVFPSQVEGLVDLRNLGDAEDLYNQAWDTITKS
jgi:spermidine/putrescine-binding protein